MYDLKIVDESIDLNLASEYHLSIQVGLDGFSFCILDKRKIKYIAFRHIPLIVGKMQFLSRKVEAIFEQEEMLNAAFGSVSVTYSTNKATLVPKEYSDPSFSHQLAGLTSNINRSEEVTINNLHGSNYQLIFSFPKELLAVFNRKYTEFSFIHKTIPLLATVLLQLNEKRNTLMINFEKKYIRMIAMKGSEISLYNSFYYKNESDFLYYTLNICHTLQINPEFDEILIGGYIASDSVYIRQLKKYFGNIHFLAPFSDYNYGNLFDKIQKHQFVSLLNTYPCV